MKDARLEEAREKARRIQRVVRLVLVCVLAIVLVYTCKRWGLRDGLIVGFIGFLFFGGVELFVATLVKP